MRPEEEARAEGRERERKTRARARDRTRGWREGGREGERRRSLLFFRVQTKQNDEKTPPKKQAWAKLCRDCDLIKFPSFTATDADLLFARVKPKGGRRIGFEGVVAALELAAQKRGCSTLELAHRVVAAGGPATAEGCTVAESVRLHDDKGTYTGVYSRGGPTTVDADPSSLAAVCDRSAADVRGVSLTMGVAATASAGLLGVSPPAPASASPSVAAGSSKRLRAGASASSLSGRAVAASASASASASPSASRKGLLVSTGGGGAAGGGGGGSRSISSSSKAFK